MLNRIAAAAIVTACLSAQPVFAADVADRAAATTTASVAGAVTFADLATAPDAEAPAALPLPVLRVPALKTSRPIVLPALYASFAMLQGYDVYSTTRAIAGGAHEANPLMTGIVGNPAVFWTVKAAMTVAPMMAAERMWKTNKIGAIAIMAASNGLMAAVAAHNASVIHQLR